MGDKLFPQYTLIGGTHRKSKADIGGMNRQRVAVDVISLQGFQVERPWKISFWPQLSASSV